MKKIHKMIIGEIIPIFILGNFFFVFLLLLEQLVELAELFFVRSIPLWLIVETIVYYLPSFLVITIPISALLAVLLAFSRFSADSELVAMHASGASGLTLLGPTLIFGIATAFTGIYISTVLVPKGSSLAVDNLNKMLENLSINDIREKEMYTDIGGMIFYANKKLDESNFEEIIVVNTADKSIISAQHGTLVPNANRSLIMQFDGGKITLTDKAQNYTGLDFARMSINFPLNINLELLPMNERLMSLEELRKNFSTDNIYRYEYAKRFSMPLATIIMAVLGMSLGSFLQRSGRSIGVILSCGVAFTFNALYLVGENLSNNYNPFLLAWMPIIIFGLIMLYPLYRAMR